MFTDYFPFGMERYLIGGLLIGLGVALLFVTTGKLGGASTFFSATWSWVSNLPFFQEASLRDSRQWRLMYALGMVLGGVVYFALGLVQLWRFVVGGLLIGFGARLGGGCTSGHGICGMASLSVGSMLMVAVFLSTAIITALTVSALEVAP